ncbi:MAG: hypothetical protein CMF68_09260, partial [Magnetovibrio sp.]|nr:hypothetical protein [Magnetovibrio sp.]
MQTDTQRDTGGAVISAVMIGIACLVIWDSLSYMDADSAVFPRTFAGVLIAASLAYIVMWLLARAKAGAAAEGGSSARRMLL